MISKIATKSPLAGRAPQMAFVRRNMGNIATATAPQGGTLRGTQAHRTATAKPTMRGFMAKKQATDQAKTDAARAAFLDSHGAHYNQELSPEESQAALQQASQNFVAANPDSVTAQQAMQAQAMQAPQMMAPQDDGSFDDGSGAPSDDSVQAQELPPEEIPGDDWESDVPWLEEQGFAGDGPLEHDEKNPIRAVSYLKDGKLCTIGVCRTPMGPVAVSHVMHAPGVSRRVHAMTQMGSDGHPTGKSLYQKAVDTAMRREAASLVYRSRQGDQNAMATLQGIGANARQGHGRASMAAQHVAAEIARQPLPAPQRIGYDDQDLFGADANRGQDRADTSMLEIVELANGPELSNEAITRLAGAFGDDGEGHAFLEGVKHCSRLAPMHGDLDFETQLIDLGRKVGLARKLQYARTPHTPIGPAFPDVAWELGE